jgi:D-cysteine desulfhydrase
MSIFAHLPRYSLAFLPTPLHPLARLDAWLAEQGIAAEIWIKRDDQTGLALGGNKTRKLEFLLADALRKGADTLITTGAVQSNHCRQTAAAAANARLECHLVLGGQAPAAPNGNLLLDMLLGAELHWTSRENRINRLMELEDELRAAGKRPYFITYGGSDPVGASGYAVALEEVLAQAHALGTTFDAIVFASSSGGTHAGLVAGSWALGSEAAVLGVSIDEAEAALREKVAALATETALLTGFPRMFAPEDVAATADYLGGGYGVVGSLEREAVSLMARAEGILLDPVYTGRAFGGLLDILRRSPERLTRGTARPRILFWHTGGAPALFAYAHDIR